MTTACYQKAIKTGLEDCILYVHGGSLWPCSLKILINPACGEVKEALEELGLDINTIEDQEPDPPRNGDLKTGSMRLDSLILNYRA